MTSFTESPCRWRQAPTNCRIVTKAADLSSVRPIDACLEELPIPLNSAIGLQPTAVPAGQAAAPAFGTLLRESLVVLTHDPGLIAAVRAVAPADHELIFVGAEPELATHLLADGAGVVVLDTAAAVNSIAQLTQRLKAQFPDLVLIVTGGAAEQAALSAQVTSGNVYRFLHKPASEQRIRLFIDAAWRRRASGGATATMSALAQPGKAAAPRRLPPGTLATVVVSIAAAAGLAGWLLGQHPAQKVSATPPAGALPRVPPPRAAPADAALQRLLERANEAFARGDWLLPPGNSAAELYRQALEHHPADAQALAGLDKVVDQVLSAAEQDLLGQHLDEAEHLTAAARAIAPNSVRVSFLATQIGRERERAARAQARLQQQQQQADALARQQELVAVARAALTAGNLDEAARSIKAAADAGVDRDAVDTLTRDLQGAQLVARMKESFAKSTSTSAPAATSAAIPAATSPAAAAPTPTPTPASTAPVTSAATSPSTPVTPAPSAAPGSEPAPKATAGSVPAAQSPAAAPQESPPHGIAVNPSVDAGTLERLRYVAPEYPLKARDNGTSGWVDLAFDVEPDGSVTHVAVLSSDPKNVFDNAAIEALRRWRYRPVQRDGHAVEQRARQRIRFTLK
jgi:protein TonB